MLSFISKDYEIQLKYKLRSWMETSVRGNLWQEDSFEHEDSQDSKSFINV